MKAVKAIGSVVSPLGAALFGGGKEKKMKPPAPVPLPDPEDPEAKLEARNRLRRRSMAGRQGTIYSGAGGAYGGANLGGTA